MAMTLSEFADVATQAGMRLKSHEDGSYLWGHWRTKLHQSPESGEKFIELHFHIEEEGQFLYVVAIGLYFLKDCPHRGSVFETLLRIAYDTKSVCFEYDTEDGEVRATVEMPLEHDGRIVPDQLETICSFMCATIDGYDTVVRHAMKTGVVDMSLEGKPLPDPEKQELNDLLAKVGGVEGLKKLAGRGKSN